LKDKSGKPIGAQAYIDGLWYKIGVHEKAFFYHEVDGWVLARRDQLEIIKIINRRAITTRVIKRNGQ